MGARRQASCPEFDFLSTARREVFNQSVLRGRVKTVRAGHLRLPIPIKCTNISVSKAVIRRMVAQASCREMSVGETPANCCIMDGFSPLCCVHEPAEYPCSEEGWFLDSANYILELRYLLETAPNARLYPRP